MKIFISACFEQQQEVCEKAEQLIKLGFYVTSRWRFEDGSLPPTPEHLHECATIDLNDIKEADYFVVLTEQKSFRGGKHFETGFAYALNKPILVIGPTENIFHSLTTIKKVTNWNEAVEELLDVEEAWKRIYGI